MTRRSREDTNQSYYQKMLKGFVSICTVIILVASLFLTTVFYQNLRNVTIDFHSELLTNAMEVIHQMLEHVASSVTQLSINSIANRYMNSRNQVEYEELAYLQSFLSNMALSNDYTDSIYIVVPERNRVISSYGFYDYNHFNDMSWYQNINASGGKLSWQGQHTIVKDKVTKVPCKVISLTCRVPFFGKNSRGYVVYNIKEAYISNLLAQAQPAEDGFVALIDLDGNIVTSSKEVTTFPYAKALYSEIEKYDLSSLNKTETIGTWNSMITLEKASISNWTYVTYTPFHALINNTAFIVFVVVVCAISLIFLSFLAIRKLTHQLYQPIEALLVYSGEGTCKNASLKKYDEFSRISSNFQTIVEDNVKLNQTLDKFKPSLVNRFFINLLHGDIQPSAVTDQYMDFLEVDTCGAACFCVFLVSLSQEVCSLSSMEQQAFYRISICDFVQREAGEYGCFVHCTQMASGYIFTTVGFEKKENVPQKIFGLCSSVSAYMMQTLRIDGDICIGDTVSSLVDINISHNQALEALTYAYNYGANPVLFYSAIGQRPAGNINPLVYEKPLLNGVKAGKGEEVLATLSQLRAEIYVGVYPLSYIRHAFYGIVNIILLGSNELSVYENILSRSQSLMDHILHSNSFEDIYQNVVDFCLMVTQEFKNSSINKIHETAGEMIDYIQNNYDKDIGLDDVANVFLYTPTHINNILKSTIGKTFYDILTEIRIDKSKQLLVSTGLQISQIGEEVGYLNTQSFIRMFKRIVGSTPGKYRKEHFSAQEYLQL